MRLGSKRGRNERGDILGPLVQHGFHELFLEFRSLDDGAILLIVTEPILVEGDDDVALLDVQLFVQVVEGLELGHLLAQTHILLGILTLLGRRHDASCKIGLLSLDFLNIFKGDFAGHYHVFIAHLRRAFINFDTALDLGSLPLHIG